MESLRGRHGCDWCSLLPDEPDSLSEAIRVVERFYTTAQQELSLIPLVDELADQEVDNLLAWLYRVGQWFPLGTATRKELLSDWANVCETSTIGGPELNEGRGIEWRRTPTLRMESVLKFLRFLRELLPRSCPSTLIDVLNWLRTPTRRFGSTENNGKMRNWSSLSGLSVPPFNGFLFDAHGKAANRSAEAELMDHWSQWCDLRVCCRAIEKSLAHVQYDLRTDISSCLDDWKQPCHPSVAAYRSIVVGWKIDDCLTRELREAIRSRGELPRRWELEEDTPIRDTKELREWLVRLRDRCFGPDLSGGIFAPSNEERLQTAKAAVINVDRALLDWGHQNRPDSGTPADLHDAERMVNRMVDWLTNTEFQGSNANDDGGKADASLTSTITVNDLLKVLGDVDWCKEKARELGERSRASGAPLQGSLAAALLINASHYQNEAAQHGKKIPKCREVEMLRTICKAADKTLSKSALEAVLAEAALRAGKTLSEVNLLSLADAVALLSPVVRRDGPDTQWRTSVDRFPATHRGDLGFVEDVAKEIADQAEFMKRQAYSDQSFNQAINGIRVRIPEALERMKSWEQSLPDHAKPVSLTLQRELSLGTIVGLAERLSPLVDSLRNAAEEMWLNSSSAGANDRIQSEVETNSISGSRSGFGGKKSKRSTSAGEARAKVIAAFTKHHDYYGGRCWNYDPIGCTALARAADVAKSTATGWFKEKFGGHFEYAAMCRRNKGKVDVIVKAANGDFSAHDYTGMVPAEVRDDGE